MLLVHVAALASFDVFPLTRGLTQTYSFRDVMHSWNFSVNTTLTDSGIVSCTIVDSTMTNDTTILWTVRQTRLVQHRIQTFPLDTTYLISDTATIPLQEYTTGNHELRSTSLLWEFPVVFEILAIYPVYRLSDSAQRVTVYKMLGCTRFGFETNYDTLWFSADSGCYRRSYSRCTDNDEYGWASWRSMHLISLEVVGVRGRQAIPPSVTLYPNYPNPFNPSTTIQYDLPSSSEAVLAVYDMFGRQIAILAEGVQRAGHHKQVFDASRLSSGMYMVRLRTPTAMQCRKMLLLK